MSRCEPPEGRSQERKAARIAHNRTHNASKPGKTYYAEYIAWCEIKRRVKNVNTAQYVNYGGRGIYISKEFDESFENFFAHIGPKPSPSHSLGRIDNDKGYEAGNVRWETAAMQNRNRRGIKLSETDVSEILRLRGKLSQAAIARKYGVCPATINHIMTGRNWPEFSRTGEIT